VERESAKDICDKSDTDFDNIIRDLITYFDKRQSKNSTSDKEIQNLLKPENLEFMRKWFKEALNEWKEIASKEIADGNKFVFNNKSHRAQIPQKQLYVEIDAYNNDDSIKKWQIPMSLRVIEPEAAIRIHTI